MKAIVTGATGFIGSHLTRRLVDSDWDVHVLNRSSSSLHRLAGLLDSLQFHDVSEIDFEAFWQSVGAVDVVFHLATAYGRNGQTDEEVLQTNVSFPQQLLSQANDHAPLCIATDTCFPTSYPYLQAYTRSKTQFANWGREWAEAGSRRFINLKLQHPFGPHDGQGKFVPWLIEQCLGNVEAIDLTSGGQEKDFIYVSDVVDALVTLTKQRAKLTEGFCEVSCGCGSAKSVRSFVELIHATTQSNSKLNFGALPDREGEPAQSVADTTALKALGWSPSISLQEGVHLTVQWHRENRQGC